MYTVSVTDLILNAVALGIILEIDDLIFDAQLCPFCGGGDNRGILPGLRCSPPRFAGFKASDHPWAAPGAPLGALAHAILPSLERSASTKQKAKWKRRLTVGFKCPFWRVQGREGLCATARARVGPSTDVRDEEHLLRQKPLSRESMFLKSQADIQGRVQLGYAKDDMRNMNSMGHWLQLA